MRDASLRNPSYQSLTNQQLSELDELCDQFDNELVNGQNPRIEDFLARAPGALVDGLLAELLAMEVEYCSQKGDQPGLEDYLQRFGRRKSIVADVFAGDSVKRRPNQQRITMAVNGPDDLGNFRLIEKIGSGGMGIVWLADQLQPVKRRVALKLIKPELTSRNVIAQFKAEKQALAMMDHPNIARVLDAGTAHDGRSYFVMELVDGIPITQYCDDKKLGVDERVELFIPVCKAVQHAHQKGIIHRDLKPTNVLVTVIDGQAVPKVIDFGLAKAVAQNLLLTDMTLQTEFGKIVGTVQYMSPEQAELKSPKAEDVDTRTDVYSLGVMLYELLTGSTPLDQKTLGCTALPDVLSLIREKDPPRPSKRLSSSSNELISIVGERRRVHPDRLKHLLRGELDWVVMKALEKDRNRRYQTANDLAQDVSSYLARKTVSARPPSTWYRIQKFTNRNRGLVAAVLAVGVVLVAGIAGTTYGLIRAHQKTRLANEKTAEASSESQRARDAEADAKFQLANARWDAQRAREARDLLHEIPPEYRDNFEWHYCNWQFDGSDFVCYGHTGAASGVAYSPDGTRIATSGSDSTIRLWDASSGHEHHILQGHQGTVEEVIFSADGSLIASTDSDNTIRIWEAGSRRCIAVFKGPRDEVIGITFSFNGGHLLSVSNDATVKRWETRSGQEVAMIEHDEQVTDVAFSPDGSRYVTCGDSGAILWDALTGRKIASQANAVQWPRSVAFSPDGMKIAVAGWDFVTVWDRELAGKLWTGINRAGWILDLNFSPDGTRLATTGNTDRQIRIWDVQTGMELYSLVGHGDTVQGVVFSPDGTRVASVSKDKTLRVWDARTGQKPMSMRAHGDRVVRVAFNNDGTRLASVSFDGTFKLWDVQSGKEMVSWPSLYKEEAAEIYCIAFSPNGDYVSFGDSSNKLALLDGRTGKKLLTFQGHNGPICGIAFSPDSKRVVSGSRDHAVKLWDIESGEQINTLKGLAGKTIKVAFGPDGRLVVVSDDMSIKLWDTQSGQVIKSLRGHDREVFDVAISPDGSRIASASNDATIRIWDLCSGQVVAQMRGHSAGVYGIAFSPDGSRIASTSFDSDLKLWDSQTGLETLTIKASIRGKKYEGESEAHSIQAAAFSPDGLRIAAGTDNGIIKFLNASKECEVETLFGHTSTVLHCSFSSEGSRIYSESESEKLVWNLATKKLEPNAAWDPPATRTQVTPDGRWLISSDRHYLVLVDLEFKNTPREKRFRAAKNLFDPEWHQEQAATAAIRNDWYAAVFNFALLIKHEPEQLSYYDSLHASFQELESQFEREKLDLWPHLPKVVRESLKLPRGNRLPEISESAADAEVLINATGDRVATPKALAQMPLTVLEFDQFRELVWQHPRDIGFNLLATAELCMSNYHEAVCAPFKSVDLPSLAFPANNAINAMSQLEPGLADRANDYRLRLHQSVTRHAHRNEYECQSISVGVEKAFETSHQSGN